MHMANMRPPVLASANEPSVKAVTGLGTAGGAGIHNRYPGEWDIYVIADNNASTGGTVQIQWQSTPPALFASCHDTLGSVSLNTVGTVTTLTWTAKPVAGKHFLRVEWATAV